MLERQNRLRGGKLFQEVFARGKRVFLGNMACFTLPLKGDTLVIGVTFKQKAFPRAITRHRYRRQLLAIVREEMVNIPKGRVLVFHFQRPFPSNTPQQFAEVVNKLVNKIAS